jgi:hypothetical protein
MDTLLLIGQLLPVAASFAPGGGKAQIFATLAGNLLAYIQQQSGMTTEQILARAGATLDQNEIDLLSDLASMEGTGGAGGGTGGTGGGVQ